MQSDLRSEKINYKIRELSLQKIPYILVVGEQGKADRYASAVRARGGKDLGVDASVDDFIDDARSQEDEAGNRAFANVTAKLKNFLGDES